METLTVLEQEILESAKKQIPLFKERIEGITPKARYLEMIFVTNHIYDKIRYDTKIQKFIKISYPYWDGEMDSETEFRIIDISEMDL